MDIKLATEVLREEITALEKHRHDHDFLVHHGRRTEKMIEAFQFFIELGERLTEENLRNIIFHYGQLTSKYQDKKNLLPGDNTFISCSQYEDLAQAIVSYLQKARE
jgi:hypothetical protein